MPEEFVIECVRHDWRLAVVPFGNYGARGWWYCTKCRENRVFKPNADARNHVL